MESALWQGKASVRAEEPLSERMNWRGCLPQLFLLISLDNVYVIKKG